jgi:RNA 3'-terminal phosphate cyclase (ATP)
MSYDYLDQVLLPMLESHFGVPHVQRQLLRREWIQGKEFVGEVRFRFKPLAPGTCLRAAKQPSLPLALSHIDITLLVPSTLRGPLLEFLDRELSKHFPSTPSKVVTDEDSGDPAGVYVLLVAHHGDSNIRLGRDHLYDQSTKGKKAEDVAAEVAQKVVRDLKAEVELGGGTDEWLEDQVAVFQGLAEGRSGRMSEPSGNAGLGEENKDADAAGKLERHMLFTRTNEPFGPGSLHAQTARWVVAQLLPGVEWFDKGAMCEGVGWKATPTRVARAEESSEIGRSIYKLANGVAEVVLQ